MRCDEAAEFVSALYDGETVPREAARHIGDCPACQAQLHAYMQMGLELRRMASLEIAEEAAPQSWKAEAAQQGKLKQWWQKGWETMRIPRFAFAAMVAGILVLASGLAITKVRARSEGPVVMLKIAVPGSNEPMLCPLNLVEMDDQLCGRLGSDRDQKHYFAYQIRPLRKDGEQISLGVRSMIVPFSDRQKVTDDQMNKQPLQEYELIPGKQVGVHFGDMGSMQLTGEWMDRMPPRSRHSYVIAPGSSEMRIVSPVLIKDGRLAGDFKGISSYPDKPGTAATLDVPGDGRFQISLYTLPGSSEAKVDSNRITFRSDGHEYILIAGAPITGSEKVWVSHNSAYRVSPEGR